MASESLIWHLIRDNNSFLVKRGQTKRDGSIQLSMEPGNLMNVNSFKYSGIANHKTIDLQTTNPNFRKANPAPAKVPFPAATSMVVMQKKVRHESFFHRTPLSPPPPILPPLPPEHFPPHIVCAPLPQSFSLVPSFLLAPLSRTFCRLTSSLWIESPSHTFSCPPHAHRISRRPPAPRPTPTQSR